ncbi:hypothetical protein Mal4_23930 [Maioricimonas rarisocia]|uniref:Cytochrome c domain-containing protein n=1 Tax=Maioricimonas rarisocia TaxID=2528026 RepID=A0A517Z6G5_9PLAN|nr:DUF1549 and DUF1553 domain-containing protein [Maioricimonas rarisocia]QDU38073.1 hypothetical protein Mal4_23930 [Maioricimonas rarisocia]
MTHAPENHDAATSAADPELERLLCDAYDAPPVPASLYTRIEQAVEKEWGTPIRQTSRRNDGSAGKWPRGARWAHARLVPIAACVITAVVIGLVMNGNSRVYAWSTVVDAFARRGLVQLDGTDSSRWLALSEGLMSQQTSAVSCLVDTRERVILEHRKGTSTVQRRPAPPGDDASSRNLLCLAFVCGDAVSDPGQLAGARLVDEEWKSHKVDGDDQVRLRVRFALPSSEKLTLDLTLDPHTSLPHTASVRRNAREYTTVAFSYPATSAAGELRQRAIPEDATFVDVSADEPLLLMASVSTDSTSPTAGREDTGRNSGVELAAIERNTSAVSTPPMEGIPSRWKPVEPVDRSTRQVVAGIDRVLEELWARNEIEPTVPATDEELLRRVYLDLAGRTPSVTEVRSYLNDPSASRYEDLVEHLLTGPDHASHLATVWRRFLIPEGVDLSRFGGIEAFDRWLADRFASNDSYDEVVRSLLLAEGRLSQSGPLLFYSAVKLDADQLASRTSRVFLGMRLECAQCHDHPFEPWTQQDFWRFAAFFGQISRPQAELETVSTVMRVRDIDRGEVMLPDSDTIVPPGFLDNKPLRAADQTTARRQQLAEWLTGADNPYFARATANRIWGQMFGRGIVDPIDDFGVQNPPRSPELLDLLASQFISSGFDLRELFRVIALSRAYRLSSGADTIDEERVEWFAQMNIKTLTAEQVYDCIAVATMLDGAGAINVERFGNTSRQEFIQQFRTPTGRSTEYLGGIPQALTLMNGGLISSATGLSSSGLLKSLEAPFFTNRERIEVLYLATLSRQPRPDEWELLDSYITESTRGVELREGLADILWALLNSAEFTLNH